MKTLLMRPYVDSTSGICPPVSIMYLSSFLKAKNLEARVLDNHFDRSTMGEFSSSNTYIQRLFRDIADYQGQVFFIL